MSRIISASPPDEVMTPMPPPGRTVRALAGGQHLGHLDQVRDLDRAMGTQQRRGRVRVPRRPAGMGRHGTPGALAAPDLQHHDRLAERGGAVERGDEALRLSDRLDKAADHRGARVLDQIFEVIGRGEHRLVARRDDVAEAEAPDIASTG